MTDETERGKSLPGTLTFGETAAPSEIARDRLESASSDATSPSSLHYRGIEDSTASSNTHSLPTSRVLTHFACLGGAALAHRLSFVHSGPAFPSSLL